MNEAIAGDPSVWIPISDYKSSWTSIDVANPSGISPTEFTCLILPSPTEEITKGGIIKPVESLTKEEFATTDGTLIAVSPLAFNYVSDEEWGDNKPKPGMKVIYPRYVGNRRKGKDGVDYLLIKDRDVIATFE